MLRVQILAAPVETTLKTVIPKSIILDLGWFDRDQTKFKDWWRSMQLFFKRNRAIATDNKITVILAWLRGGTASIYAQKKIDQIKYYDNT